MNRRRDIALNISGEQTVIRAGLSSAEFNAVADAAIDAWLDAEPPRPSCALDVADAGATTLESVARLVALTRERVRQIEAAAIEKMAKRVPAELELDSTELTNG